MLCVVLLAIDVPRKPVLLAVQDPAVPSRQIPAVRSAHPALLAVQRGFPVLEPPRFPGRELAASDSLRDASLLARLALLDRALRGRSRGDEQTGKSRGSGP